MKKRKQKYQRAKQKLLDDWKNIYIQGDKECRQNKTHQLKLVNFLGLKYSWRFKKRRVQQKQLLFVSGLWKILLLALRVIAASSTKLEKVLFVPISNKPHLIRLWSTVLIIIPLCIFLVVFLHNSSLMYCHANICLSIENFSTYKWLLLLLLSKQAMWYSLFHLLIFTLALKEKYLWELRSLTLPLMFCVTLVLET